MTTASTSQTDAAKLTKLADEIQAEREMAEATLDGLDARIDATIAALENSDIDAGMTRADEDVAKMAEDALRADAADMESLDTELADADKEEDQLLEDDELPAEETAARLTPEDTGLKEE